MSKRDFVFVDDSGGALAVLAASVAQNLGHAAKATTTSSAVDVPSEVRTALDEIGAAVVDVVPRGSIPTDAGVTRVGRGAPNGFDVWLVPGEELERVSSARIARDRIERALDPQPPLAS